jgi:hypothetical protein
MMHAALGVHFWGIGAWTREVGELCTREDVEIVIGSVAACVPLCSDSGSKDYEILRYA